MHGHMNEKEHTGMLKGRPKLIANCRFSRGYLNVTSFQVLTIAMTNTDFSGR